MAGELRRYASQTDPQPVLPVFGTKQHLTNGGATGGWGLNHERDSHFGRGLGAARRHVEWQLCSAHETHARLAVGEYLAALLGGGDDRGAVVFGDGDGSTSGRCLPSRLLVRTHQGDAVRIWMGHWFGVLRLGYRQGWDGAGLRHRPGHHCIVWLAA